MLRLAQKFSRGRLAAGVLAASLVASAALVGVPAHAAPEIGFAVSGTVSAEGVTAADGTGVSLESKLTSSRSYSTPVMGGSYSFANVIPGDYWLYVGSEFMVDRVELTVTDANVVKNVETELLGSIGAQISVAGAPESMWIDVSVYDSRTGALAAENMVHANETTTLSQLTPGTYKVGFSKSSTGSSSVELDDQFYDAVPTLGDATIVTITGGKRSSVAAGWNADGTIVGYEAPVEDGTVSGVVATELPTEGLDVDVTLIPEIPGRWGFTTVDFANGGAYSANVKPGFYKVGFALASSGSSQATVDPTWFGGKDQESAKLVEVKSGESTTGIDVTLTGTLIAEPSTPTTPTTPITPATPTTPTTPGANLPVTGGGASGSVTAGVSSSGTVTPGEGISVAATGLPANAEIGVYLHSTPLFLGMLKTNASGGLSGSVTLPATAPAGAHQIVLHYTVNGIATELAIAAVTITPEASTAAIAKAKAVAAKAKAERLASTGSDTMMSVLLMTLLLAAGVSATLVSRRKRVTASV